MKNEEQNAFPLDWEEMWDTEHEWDNYMWEAVSPFSDDGDPFIYRIRQRLREGRIEFYDASAPELREEGDDRFWLSLDEAKAALQEDANEIALSAKTA